MNDSEVEAKKTGKATLDKMKKIKERKKKERQIDREVYFLKVVQRVDHLEYLQRVFHRKLYLASKSISLFRENPA